MECYYLSYLYSWLKVSDKWFLISWEVLISDSGVGVLLKNPLIYFIRKYSFSYSCSIRNWNEFFMLRFRCGINCAHYTIPILFVSKRFTHIFYFIRISLVNKFKRENREKIRCKSNNEFLYFILHFLNQNLIEFIAHILRNNWLDIIQFQLHTNTKTIEIDLTLIEIKLNNWNGIIELNISLSIFRIKNEANNCDFYRWTHKSLSQYHHILSIILNHKRKIVQVI